MAMDTGVQHGPQPDVHAPTTDGTSGPGGGDSPVHDGEDGPAAPSRAVPHDDVPTTILDLRTAFAEAGAEDSPPLGMVQVEREHPMRAAIAFLAVLAFIALAAGAVVVGVVRAGHAVYDRVAGPASCSQRQVADGAALETWLLATTRSAVGASAAVRRTGCVTAGGLDPLTGQSATTTVRAGTATTRMVAVLKKRGCTLGAASPSGRRTCTVEVGGRLTSVELKPDRAKKTTVVTVNFW